LAAFGVTRMGLGNCENLLKSYSIKDIFTLDENQVADIDGFADLTAALIVKGLKTIRNEFDELLQYQFNLEITPVYMDAIKISHELSGRKIVFTGKMNGSREVMKKNAKKLGIQVASSVTGKTDYLVIGDNVGQKKIEAAEKFGLTILSERDYLAMVEV
jgi:DNA ligase (NAD+)